ncbi:hypothetical protein ATY78_20210 [Rhizobium sp. R635]|nr:hypothetical protein ATY78_20210 [Rhizobium sp. R635]
MEERTEHDRFGLSFRSSSPAAIRRSAAQRAGFGLQNLLSIHLDIFPDVYPAIALRISVLLPLRGSTGFEPASQWFMSPACEAAP